MTTTKRVRMCAGVRICTDSFGIAATLFRRYSHSVKLAYPAQGVFGRTTGK